MIARQSQNSILATLSDTSESVNCRSGSEYRRFEKYQVMTDEITVETAATAIVTRTLDSMIIVIIVDSRIYL